MRIKCQNCGYEWKPRVKKPKRCPFCAISRRYGNFRIVKKAKKEKNTEKNMGFEENAGN